MLYNGRPQCVRQGRPRVDPSGLLQRVRSKPLGQKRVSFSQRVRDPPGKSMRLRRPGESVPNARGRFSSPGRAYSS